MAVESLPDERLSYRGYIIEPHPYLLRDVGCWDSSLAIRRSFGGEIREWPRCGEPRFASRDEAVQFCIRYGQQIIDGGYPNAALI
jgi:hypothetical protein